VNATTARASFALNNVALWLVYLVLDTGSQLSFKWAADSAGATTMNLDWLLRAARAPGLWLGIACYVGTLLVWLRILARTDLSRAFPMSGLAYLTVPLLAIVLFGESITFLEATGIAAICTGVALLGSEHAPESPPPSYPG